jgi:hypothetical protein
MWSANQPDQDPSREMDEALTYLAVSCLLRILDVVSNHVRLYKADWTHLSRYLPGTSIKHQDKNKRGSISLTLFCRHTQEPVTAAGQELAYGLGRKKRIIIIRDGIMSSDLVFHISRFIVRPSTTLRQGEYMRGRIHQIAPGGHTQLEYLGLRLNSGGQCHTIELD